MWGCATAALVIVLGTALAAAVANLSGSPEAMIVAMIPGWIVVLPYAVLVIHRESRLLLFAGFVIAWMCMVVASV